MANKQLILVFVSILVLFHLEPSALSYGFHERKAIFRNNRAFQKNVQYITLDTDYA